MEAGQTEIVAPEFDDLVAIVEDDDHPVLPMDMTLVDLLLEHRVLAIVAARSHVERLMGEIVGGEPPFGLTAPAIVAAREQEDSGFRRAGRDQAMHELHRLIDLVVLAGGGVEGASVAEEREGAVDVEDDTGRK